MKGVLLAGGTGSRLFPLTRITNKHLLPIGDRPMVSYAIENLAAAGITEVMVVTGRIADRIADPNSEGATIQEQIAEGDYHGMQSFDQALRKLVLDKRISVQSALSASSSPHDLLVSLEAAGVPVRREAAGVA